MDVASLFELAMVGLGRASLATLPVFVIVLTITAVGRRWLAPWARHALWSLVLVRLLLPVSFGSPVSLQSCVPQFRGTFPKLGEPPNPQSPADLAVRSNSAEQAWAPVTPYSQPLPHDAAVQEVDWLATVTKIAVASVLFCGMIVVATWTVVTTWQLRRLVNAGTESQREDWLIILAQGQRRFGVNGRVSLRILPSLAGPATCGWWRPSILLPADAGTWSSTQLRHVLWHELGHISRHDVAANWLLAVIRILHWWNPMFWWAERAWLAERELACDALVVQRLEGTDVREYGQTLLRFLERLSTNRGARISTTAPGFVSFWGRKRDVRRRLAELEGLIQPERNWRRWAACGLLMVLTVAGLTDAAAPPEPRPPTGPVELPSGITWSLAPPAAAEADAPRTVQTHDVSAAIAHLRKEDPELSVKVAALSLQQLLRGVLQPGVDTATSPHQPPAATCVIQDQTLVANATAEQHEEIRQLLKRWSKSGLRQVSVEERTITTRVSLKDLVRGSGGTVVNVAPVSDAQQLSTHREQTVPAFVKVLDHEGMVALMAKVQGDGESNCLFAPKVTTFDGMSVTLLCGVQRPFVTGLRSVDQGVEPQISVVTEGVQIQFRPRLAADGKATQLQLQYQESRVDRVEVLETKSADESSSVQIPHVSRSVVATDSEIPEGHTLLVAPIRRDEQGKLRLYLITPRVLQ